MVFTPSGVDTLQLVLTFHRGINTMPQLTQGLIVALLIGLLLAVIVGYYLRQGQVNELTDALQQSQQRQDDLGQEHEQRLRDATEQLRKDYGVQLAEKMEQYQAQFEVQRNQIEAEYRSRQALSDGSAPGEANNGAEQRIRKQYETRLKEVAAKMQQAYEVHLQERLLEVRSEAQREYDQRLAEAIAHYQDQAQARLDQSSSISLGNLVPESPTAEVVDGPTLAALAARLQAEYDQRLAKRLAEYQDSMGERSAQLEQEYEARLSMASAAGPAPATSHPSPEELELNLRRELEDHLRGEYEQKLAEKIEHYQDQLTQRTQELAQSYEARLQLLQPTSPVEPTLPAADSGELDLDRAIAAANEATLAASVNIDLPGEPSPADAETLDFGNLLDIDLDGDQDNSVGGTATFDADALDIDALLNAAPPDPAADDLLDSLDDITDLS